MTEPRRKRPKISRGEDDYMPRNIVEIELHNFMTFNNLTCKPGPHLNLVVGPNGSGKSAPKKDVIEVIQPFNIQVNNLTQ
ncbi:Structural maintenance of chromosomes protein, partial [Actinidia chinensis var. chinensis]